KYWTSNPVFIDAPVNSSRALQLLCYKVSRPRCAFKMKLFQSLRILKLKHIAWTSGGVFAFLVLFFVNPRTKPAAKPSPPLVEVAQVETRDVPVYGEWI